MKNIFELIAQSMMFNRIQEFELLIRQYQNSILQIKNIKGQNIIHLLCQFDVQYLKLFVSITKQQKHFRQNLKKILNETDNNNQVPLFLCIKRGILVFQKQYDIDFLFQDFQGQNCLHFCIKFNQLAIFIYLVEKISINQPMNNGCTPLMYAVQCWAIDFVRLIVKFKNNINMQDKKGNTALHYAIIENKSRIAYYLLMNGSDSEIKNINNKTAKQIALNSPNEHLNKLFVFQQEKQKLFQKFYQPRINC